MAASNFSCLTGDTPVNLSKTFICNAGFYCPNNDEKHPPQYCPPEKLCQAKRLLLIKNICQEPQGFYEPTICSPGFYCPLNEGTELRCPKGFYCPAGTVHPLKCTGIGICPAGSSKQIPLTGLVILIIIDLILIAVALQTQIRYLVQWYKKKTSSKSAVHASVEETEKSKDEDVQVNGVSDFHILEEFVTSSKRGMGLESTRMEIGFNQLGLKLGRKQKTVLEGVTGYAGPGSLLAVMGASGSGKSTFVRVLMGKAKATSGSTTINGIPRNISDFKKIIGYVPQDDVVLPELTVHENLLHAARMRLPKTWTAEEIKDHVDTLMQSLNLSCVKDNLVGRVSGGQRKRVSIGMELAAAPMVLILDEPTSGLDATSALSIIKLLRSLSSLGVTVICIIHQPREEIFLSFDRLLLLSGGRQVYFGSTKESAGYFRDLGYELSNDVNPADAIMDITSGNVQRYLSKSLQGRSHSNEELARIWTTKQDMAQIPYEPVQHQVNSSMSLATLATFASARGAPRMRQVYFCFLRAFTQQTRQHVGFFLEIAVGGIAGLMIGLSVYQLDGLLFQGMYLPPFELLSSATNYWLIPQLGQFTSVAIGLAAAAPGVRTFGEEKEMYWRESASGHSRSAYFVGKILSTLFRIGLSALHFTLFYALLATPIMPFGQLYLANLLYFYCIYGLACALSIVVSRQDGPLLATIASLIIGVFGGYGPSLSTVKTWHLEWIWRMCPGTWFSEAYFQGHTSPFSYLWDIDAAAKWTGYTLNQMNLDLGMLFIIGTVYRVLAYVGLISLNRDKQV